MNTRTTILTSLGVSVVALVIGVSLGTLVFPTTNTSILISTIPPKTETSTRTITLSPSTLVYSETATVTTTLATSITANPITSTLSQITTTTKTVSNSTTVTNYQSVSANYSPTGLSGNSTNLTLGMRLQFSINTSSVSVDNFTSSESPILLDISDFNILSKMNNISASSSWTIPIRNLSVGGCNVYNYPFAFEVFKGYFDSQNVTSSNSSISLFPIIPCPSEEFTAAYYHFTPNSNLAAILSKPYYTVPPPYTTTLTIEDNYALKPMAESISLNGYWVNYLTYNLLAKGIYTIAAADQWGNLVVLHFTVVN